MTLRTWAKRLLASVLVAATVIATVPGTASAYTYFDGNKHSWGSDGVRWCFETFPKVYRDTAITAMTEINNNGLGADLFLTKVAPDSAWPNDCNIHVSWVDFSSRGWPANAGRTTRSLNFLGFYTRADVYINSDKESKFWFGEGLQYNIYGNVCKVGDNTNAGCAKDIDFLTVVLHEGLHSVGLGENLTSTVCDAGYRMNQVDDACTNDFYSNDPMYANAGDGYRRGDLLTDSSNGLADLY